jgi:hypothetical protein
MEQYTASARVRHRQRDGETVLSCGEICAQACLTRLPVGCIF